MEKQRPYHQLFEEYQDKYRKALEDYEREFKQACQSPSKQQEEIGRVLLIRAQTPQRPQDETLSYKREAKNHRELREPQVGKAGKERTAVTLYERKKSFRISKNSKINFKQHKRVARKLQDPQDTTKAGQEHPKNRRTYGQHPKGTHGPPTDKTVDEVHQDAPKTYEEHKKNRRTYGQQHTKGMHGPPTHNMKVDEVHQGAPKSYEEHKKNRRIYGHHTKGMHGPPTDMTVDEIHQGAPKARQEHPKNRRIYGRHTEGMADMTADEVHRVAPKAGEEHNKNRRIHGQHTKGMHGPPTDNTTVDEVHQGARKACEEYNKNRRTYGQQHTKGMHRPPIENMAVDEVHQVAPKPQGLQEKHPKNRRRIKERMTVDQIGQTLRYGFKNISKHSKVIRKSKRSLPSMGLIRRHPKLFKSTGVSLKAKCKKKPCEKINWHDFAMCDECTFGWDPITKTIINYTQIPELDLGLFGNHEENKQKYSGGIDQINVPAEEVQHKEKSLGVKNHCEELAQRKEKFVSVKNHCEEMPQMAPTENQVEAAAMCEQIEEPTVETPCENLVKVPSERVAPVNIMKKRFRWLNFWSR